MGQKKISIITPVLNGARFIERCLRNVIEQNCCDDLEHLVLDGGSTDGTVAVVRRFCQDYSHIRLVSEEDQGQSDAMNKGLALASGDIVGFLNVDDSYEPGTLSEALRLMRDQPEPTLLVGNCNVWDNEGRLWFVSRPARIGLANLLLGRYLEAFPMNPSAYFYHKSLHDRIGCFAVDEHYAMDVHFIFRAVQWAKVVYVDRTWGNYHYLEGTKTYQDDQRGDNDRRLKRICGEYRRQQPLLYRAWLGVLWVWHRLSRLVHNPPSQLDRP